MSPVLTRESLSRAKPTETASTTTILDNVMVTLSLEVLGEIWIDSPSLDPVTIAHCHSITRPRQVPILCL